MPATAKLSFARFMGENLRPLLCSKMGCHFRDTTASTKEGLSGDDNIVSNLHEQIEPSGHLGITRSHHYGAQQYPRCRIVSIASCLNCYLG